MTGGKKRVPTSKKIIQLLLRLRDNRKYIKKILLTCAHVSNFRFVCRLLFCQGTTYTLWCDCDLGGIVLSCTPMWGVHFIHLLHYWLHLDLVDHCTKCMNHGSDVGWIQGRVLLVFFSGSNSVWFVFTSINFLSFT